MRLPGLLSLAIVVVVLDGCAAPRGAPVRHAAAQQNAVSIYLVGHGGHTGIVIGQGDVPQELWPERRDFPDAERFEVGWGDHDFYQSPAPDPWMTFKAAFLPTASVLHVVGFRGAVADHFRANEIVAIALPRAGLDGLARYIHDAHIRSGVAPAAPIGPGLYGDGRFYAARETFHLFRNCNVWTARALRAAGLPVRDAITSEGLMSQARALGTIVRAAPP